MTRPPPQNCFDPLTCGELFARAMKATGTDPLCVVRGPGGHLLHEYAVDRLKVYTHLRAMGHSAADIAEIVLGKRTSHSSVSEALRRSPKPAAEIPERALPLALPRVAAPPIRVLPLKRRAEEDREGTPDPDNYLVHDGTLNSEHW